jgi:hypothetical protein
MPTEKLPGDHQLRRQPDHGDVLQSEDQAVDGAVEDRQVLDQDAGIGLVDDQVLVGRAPLRFAQVELDGHHAAQRLDEVGRRLALVRQLFVKRAALGAVKEPARRAVGQRRSQDDGGQRGAVPEHHAEREQHHRAVDERFEERDAQGALDRVDAAKTRDDVADVALFEPGQRQAQQLAEERIEQAHVEHGREVDAQPAAHRGDQRPA